MVSKIVTYAGTALALAATAFGGFKLIQKMDEKFNPEYWQDKVAVAIDLRQAYLKDIGELVAESKDNWRVWNDGIMVCDGLGRVTTTFEDFDHLRPVIIEGGWKDPAEFAYDMGIYDSGLTDLLGPKGIITSYLNKTFFFPADSRAYFSRFVSDSEWGGFINLGKRLQGLYDEVNARFSDAAKQEAINYAATFTRIVDGIVGGSVGMAIFGIPLAFMINILSRNNYKKD